MRSVQDPPFARQVQPAVRLAAGRGHGAEWQEQETVKAETELYEQIGRLKMELEWLKKKLLETAAARCAMIEPNHEQLSVRRQCELLGLNRASYYYRPATESVLNLELMRCIDEQYLKTPFYGWPRMTAHLRRQGYAVNHKRVQRLMQVMAVAAHWTTSSSSGCGVQSRVRVSNTRTLTTTLLSAFLASASSISLNSVRSR